MLTILLPQLLGLDWTLSGAVECEGPLYPSEESLRELGISGPTLLHCSDQDGLRTPVNA